MATIYIFVNRINNKPYVGQTTSFKHRLDTHKYGNQLIDKAIRKYGIENFDQLLLENIPEEELDYWETHYIEEHHSLVPSGYNLDTGGHENKHHCEKTLKKLREMNAGEKNPFFGEHHSNEAKKKMSESKIANPSKTRFQKERIPWNKKLKGEHFSEEHKRKISETLKGMANPSKTRFQKGCIPWNKGKKLCP